MAVRVLTRDPEARVHPGAGTIADRFKRAAQLRWLVLGPDRPTAMRLFSGDSEGLPGVNVDRYGDFVVVQWLTGGALPWRDELYDAIEEVVEARSGFTNSVACDPWAGRPPPSPPCAPGARRRPWRWWSRRRAAASPSTSPPRWASGSIRICAGAGTRSPPGPPTAGC